MEDQMKNPIAHANPYSVHHEMLRQQILQAASVDRESLDDAGIELTLVWLPELLGSRGGSLRYPTRFDALKCLHIVDELSVHDTESIVTTMQRSDVFFALALAENDIAHWLFSEAPLATDWDEATAVLIGLNAAVSATSSYMFGLSLKTQMSQLH